MSLKVESLTVTLPDGRALLRDAGLTVADGEMVVLVGPSGSGKSTLLNLIAGNRDGADGVEVSGEVGVGDGARVGVVFQQLALFDELSPAENVQFAIDHRGEPGEAGEAEGRLEAMSAPTQGRTGRLSGGERQRVAIARTLAMEPDILLFDEPTTGLDPHRAREAAGLISDTHRESGATVIVVTHDYRAFLPHSPRLVLLDPAAKRLRDVGSDELDDFFAGPAECGGPGGAARPQPLLERARPWVEGPGRALLTLLDAGRAPFQGWGRAKWKARYLRHYSGMVLFGTTMIYVAIAGMLLGFVTVSFGFSQLPYRDMTLPLVLEEFLSATGYGAFRVVAPLLICVLLASKCGAAVAADVGARRMARQFEAMRSLGAEPRHYLYGNIALSLSLAGPALTLVAFASNWYASLVAFLLSSDASTVAVFRRNYLATLWDGTFPDGMGWVMLKTAVSGLLIAALSYVLGARAKSSPTDVSRDVGLTIFWASLAVLGLHAALAFVEF